MNDPARNPYASGSGTGVDSNNGAAQFRGAVQTGKLITFGLLMGLLTTTSILTVLWITSGPHEKPVFRFDEDSMIFIVIGFGKLIICSIGWVVMRLLFNRKIAEILKSSSEPFPVPIRDDTLLPPQTQTAIQAMVTSNLIGQALMEGPAMLNAILMFIEHNAIFAIPVVIGFVGVLLQLPTVSKYKSRLENAAL